MSRIGFQPSQLMEAMKRGTEIVELRERLEHASPAAMVPIKLEVQDGGAFSDGIYYVGRAALLEVVEKEEKRLVERAHRLMHGVTGD